MVEHQKSEMSGWFFLQYVFKATYIPDRFPIGAVALGVVQCLGGREVPPGLTGALEDCLFRSGVRFEPKTKVIGSRIDFPAMNNDRRPDAHRHEENQGQGADRLTLPRTRQFHHRSASGQRE